MNIMVELDDESEDPKSHWASFSGENDDDDEIQASSSEMWYIWSPNVTPHLLKLAFDFRWREAVTAKRGNILCGLALKLNCFPTYPNKIELWKQHRSRVGLNVAYVQLFSTQITRCIKSNCSFWQQAAS